MNSYRMLEDKYRLLNKSNFKLTSIDDIERLYSVYPLKVRGFKELTEKQKLHYKNFITSFFNSWGLETRENIEPLEVKYIKEADYIRVDFKRNGKDEWYHLLCNGEWY